MTALKITSTDQMALNQFSKAIYLSFCLICLTASVALAQNDEIFKNLKFKTQNSEETYEYLVQTLSGSQIKGELIGIKYGKLEVLSKDLGTVQVDLKDIKQIDPINGSEGPSLEYQRNQQANSSTSDDKHIVGSNHYFISPSSFGPRKGEGQFQVTYLFFLSGSYGITDNISISGGISILPGIGLDEQLFYIIPKVSFPITPKIKVGAQLTYFTIFDENLGLLSLTSTFGEEDKNLTVGLSYGLINGELVHLPLLNIAGVIRVSKRLALITDNYIGTGDISDVGGLVYSLGIRILSGQSAFDLGLWSVGDENSIVIPYLNYTLRF